MTIDNPTMPVDVKTLKVGDSKNFTCENVQGAGDVKAVVRRVRRHEYFLQDEKGKRGGHARWGNRKEIIGDIEFLCEYGRLPRAEAGKSFGEKGKSRA